MNNLKKHIVIYVTIVLLLVIGTFTITYSYFLALPKADDTITPSNVETGKLVLDFVTNTYINADKLPLINDSDKDTEAPYTEFIVSHNEESNVSASYDLYITELEISENFKSEYFKWELVRVSQGTEEIINSGNFLNATTGNDFKLNSNTITLSVDDIHLYKLRIWLSNDENKNQLELTNGSFKGKVKVTAVNS